MIAHNDLLNLGRHQIHQRENEHPNQIDEVPIEAADLNILILELTAPHGEGDDAQVNDADDDVRHVQTGEGKKRAAEQRYAPFVVERRNVLVVDQVQPLR